MGMAVGFNTGRVDLLTINFTEKRIQELKTFTPEISSPALQLAWSSSNKFLAVSFATGDIIIYQITNFQIVSIIHAHEKRCQAITFCPFNDHIIASGGYDRNLFLYDWYGCPDYPIEHMDLSYAGAPHTSLIWPFSSSAVFAATESAFAADRLHGVHC